VGRNLDKCTLQDKKKALDVQIVTIQEKKKIRIAVPLEFVTIERTSGYTLCRAKNKRAEVYVS
jgi:hypothetical protein